MGIGRGDACIAPTATSDVEIVYLGMPTPELRKKLIARIRATSDVKLLREMERMLKDAGREIAPFITTPDQKKAIAKSRTALKRGRVRPAAEADKAIREWLEK